MAPGSDARFDRFVGVQSNVAGDLAFSAHLRREGEEELFGSGSYFYDGSSVRTLITSGQAAPGAPDGFRFTDGGGVYLNDAGQLAFIVGIDNPSDPAEPVFSIWLGDADGGMSLLVKGGDALTVAPGDVRTIHFLAIDQLLDDGNVVFWAQFEDGTQGLFVTAVPEPAAALTALVTGLLVRRRAR